MVPSLIGEYLRVFSKKRFPRVPIPCQLPAEPCRHISVRFGLHMAVVRTGTPSHDHRCLCLLKYLLHIRKRCNETIIQPVSAHHEPRHIDCRSVIFPTVHFNLSANDSVTAETVTTVLKRPPPFRNKIVFTAPTPPGSGRRSPDFPHQSFEKHAFSVRRQLVHEFQSPFRRVSESRIPVRIAHDNKAPAGKMFKIGSSRSQVEVVPFKRNTMGHFRFSVSSRFGYHTR